MRKISLLTTLLFLLLSFGIGISAQEDGLPSPGLTPDSPFYFLERISEGIGTFFTFGDLKKAERYAALAAERVAEAKAVVEKGRPEAAQIALERYEYQLERALAKAVVAKAKGKSISEVTDIIAQATAKHLTVLEEVLERVPEQAKPAILRAREVSVTGQVRALESLSKDKPERAAALNFQTIQGRLGKAKEEAVELNGEDMGRSLADFSVFRASLEKMGKENKAVLASLVSENMIGQIEDLDELEDEAENISSEMIERVKTIKGNTIDGQTQVLGSLASVDPERATEINLKAAEARLNRAKAKAEEGEMEAMEEAITEFENQHRFGEEISQIAQGLGKDTTTVEQLVGRATSIHLEILAEVYGKVPEQAKASIEEAMNISVEGHERAVESLKAKGAIDEVPEEVPVPDELPEEVKERIRKPGTPRP